MRVERAIAAFVERAIGEGGLVLVEGAAPDDLIAELLLALGEQAAFAQLGPFLATALIRSERVEELFLNDRQIVRMFNDLR